MGERLRSWTHGLADDGGRPRVPERFAPVVVGEPIFAFEPKPPAPGPYRADTVCDGWSSDHFTVRLASVRGYAHRYHGLPRQDDAEVYCHPQSGAVIFAVADGVASARLAHVGATTACRSAVHTLRYELDSGAGIDWGGVLGHAVRSLTREAATALHQHHPSQAAVLELLATTLVAGYITMTEAGPVASMVQVGDTSAWILSDGRYECVLNEKHDPREQVISSAAAPLPWLPDPVSPATVGVPPGAVLLIGTDGIGDPLGDGDGRVGMLLADCLQTPPPPRAFAHVLDFSRETFDDDRTLVGIWSHTADAEGVR